MKNLAPAASRWKHHYSSFFGVERRLQRKRIPAIVAIALFLLAEAHSQATPGDLDPSFAGTGATRLGFGGGNDSGNAVAAQADGKLVAVGAGEGKFLVVRYATDGSRDSSFGDSGKVLTAVGSSAAVANAVGIQADGKIIVAGYAQNGGTVHDFAVVRYNSDGSLDASFGSGGIVITELGGTNNTEGRALAIQADNKIIVAGIISSPGGGYEVVRYNSNGLLDTSFGGNGIVSGGGQGVNGNAVTLQSDGKILCAGLRGIVRLNTNGSSDTSFSGDGFATVDNNFDIHSIAIQPANDVFTPAKIVVGGDFFTTKLNLAAARLNLAGTLDTSFGGSGIVSTSISTNFSSGTAVIVQSGGTPLNPIRKIIVAGYSGNISAFQIVRYNTSGSLDTSFDGDGVLATLIGASGGHAAAMTLALGQLVVVGGCFNISNDLAVARYSLADGSLDTSFNGNGKRTDDFSDLGYGAGAGAVAIQSDGKVVVAGSASNGSNQDFALARYYADGTLDKSFGSYGKVTTAIGTNDENASAVVIQPDGKIVVAGSTSTSSSTHFAVVRYNPDGSLDSTFGSAGKVITPIGNVSDVAHSVALQSDGKIVVAGSTSNGNNDDFAVARYNPNGSLDTTFDGDGKVITAIGTEDDAAAVKIQADGKIVVAGSTTIGSIVEIAVVRYNINGSTDNSFGSFGRVATQVEMGAAGEALAIQPDGKLIVAGAAIAAGGGGSLDFALVRYNANGSLDNSFGSDGKVTTAIGLVDDFGSGVVIQPDNKILVTGYSTIGARDFAVVRYNGDGSLDNSYGSGGKVVIDVSGGDDFANGIALDSLGRAVLAGSSDGLFGLVRLLGDPLVKIISITRRTSDSHIILDGLALPGVSNSLKQATALSSTSFSLLTTVSPDAMGNWEVDVGLPSSPHFYQLTSP